MTLDLDAPNRLLSGAVEKLDCVELELKLDDRDAESEMPEETKAFINKLGPGLWFQYQVMQIRRDRGPDRHMRKKRGMTGLQENDLKAANELEWPPE
ncbi:MAG: hypothetical protein IPM37_13575 [Hahellaceae bacterium]|nr:hypothetical protein [Hahellaceae bacterium]